MEPEAFSDRIESACRKRHGAEARIRAAKPLSAGASAATWQFELEVDGETWPMIAQLFTGEQQFAAALDKRTQGEVQQRAWEAGIPTPRVDFILDPADDLGEGFVSEFTAGETLGHRIARDERFAAARRRMTRQCGEILANIHRIDTATLPPLPQSSPAAMVQDLLEIHDAFGQRIPTFELAFRWLADRAGHGVAATLVHGDFRNGNLIVDESGIARVLDWEMAHLGDPLEDLGWLCMNAWRFGVIDKPVGGFGDRQTLYGEYERASGHPVDPERVRFWEVFGALKWGLVCQWFAQQFASGEVRSIERAAIGRRVSEVEIDLLDLIEGVE